VTCKAAHAASPTSPAACRSVITVNELFRRYGEGVSVTADGDRVVRALTRCRTAALGGHIHACKACATKHHVYHSCRDRHCPTCQHGAREKWVADRADDLLPVPYFHVVFTLPEELRALALRNKVAVYGILMRTAWETLRDVGRSKLKAELGAFGILHTWGQAQVHHPHAHFVVPSGGLCETGWRRGRADYLLPVKALRRTFRGKFLAALDRAYARHELEFSGRCEEYSSPTAFAELLRLVAQKRWVVRVKKPFGGPKMVLRYLGNYTHRVAISNNRILHADEKNVTFLWKDYADGSKKKTMTLATREFLRRFLLHALPKGFVKIRHFGFLAHPVKKKRLAEVRRLLGARSAAPKPPAEKAAYVPRCLHCGSTEIIVVGVLAPMPFRKPIEDTS
jgi:hypothetical protein